MEGNPNGILVPYPSWSNVAPNLQESAAGGDMNFRPATHVSRYDAIVFANRLSIMHGLTPAYELPNQWPNPTSWSSDPNTWGAVPQPALLSWDHRWNAARIAPGNPTGYRLPTEAQWEFAAKGGVTGETFTFSGSDNPSLVAWHHSPGNPGHSDGSPRMVGLLIPNGLGIHDMSGNVLEWTQSWVENNWEHPGGTRIDHPGGAVSGTGFASRGGNWSMIANGVRSVHRHGGNPSRRQHAEGFRLVRPAP